MTPLLVVIGPSSSGKSTVVRELHRRGVVATPTWTSRPRRADELADTVEHRFVTEAEFDGLEWRGFFLEVVRAFGLPYRYGVPRPDPAVDGRVPVLMARAPFPGHVGRHFPDHVVYQIEESYRRARRRVVGREPTSVGLGHRLLEFEPERRAGRRAARRTFANQGPVDALVTAVADAIRADFHTEGEDR